MIPVSPRTSFMLRYILPPPQRRSRFSLPVLSNFASFEKVVFCAPHRPGQALSIHSRDVTRSPSIEYSADRRIGQGGKNSLAPKTVRVDADSANEVYLQGICPISRVAGLVWPWFSVVSVRLVRRRVASSLPQRASQTLPLKHNPARQ